MIALATFFWITIGEFAVVGLVLLFLRHKDWRIGRDLNVAIAYALRMRNSQRAEVFFRAFLDDDRDFLEAEFRDWFDYRDDVYVMGPF